MRAPGRTPSRFARMIPLLREPVDTKLETQRIFVGTSTSTGEYRGRKSTAQTSHFEKSTLWDNITLSYDPPRPIKFTGNVQPLAVATTFNHGCNRQG